MAKSPAWTRKEGKSESGGLNAKGRASYNAANPGKPGLKRPQPDSRINKSLRAWNCKEGGSVRGGGCEIRGKTKGRMV
jgi:hypothetical protein